MLLMEPPVNAAETLSVTRWSLEWSIGPPSALGLEVTGRIQMPLNLLELRI